MAEELNYGSHGPDLAACQFLLREAIHGRLLVEHPVGTAFVRKGSEPSYLRLVVSSHSFSPQQYSFLPVLPPLHCVIARGRVMAALIFDLFGRPAGGPLL